ncbi:MAG: lamin tail domain-containing protein [Verrucomicrobia bacterium]|nr:lamin tail domain-containing protein [Verrucomicrobiota bacterium]
MIVTRRRKSHRGGLPLALAFLLWAGVAASYGQTNGQFVAQDIGSPVLPGAITYVDNGANVIGGGRDIGGTSDQFFFSWQRLAGDFDVKVRLQQLDFADTWTKAGLMAREDLTAGSREVSVLATPSLAGLFFLYRTSVGGNTTMKGTLPVNYPNTWLRLQRVTNQFTGYGSLDGQTWTQLGTVSNALPANAYLGFAVSSRNEAQPTTAQFQDFGDNIGGTVGLLPVSTEPLGPSSRRTGLVFSEVMYHPPDRPDEFDLEFIELFNSNPWFEDISGYRISGDIDYTFPEGTLLQGGAFLVVARSPADVQAIYGIANVMGPYANNLPNGAGTVRLRNASDAILLGVSYDTKPPWPIAADGAGHSLVLARPSYGEGDPRAWSQSDVMGGSPGTVDGVRFEPARNVLINEFRAHSAPTQEDFIELYNHSTIAVDLSGCWLSDDPSASKFRIPEGTVIGPAGFVSFAESALGFGLNAGGEAIYFINAGHTRVLDALVFEGQELGISSGRSPDGAPTIQPLAAPTPGGSNAPARLQDIVINEIMYHPITEDENDQFVELYNRGSSVISLANWQFTDGISYTFPSNAVLAPSGYLVVARNAARLLTNYPNLNVTNTFGNFSGSLGGSGERLALSKPEFTVTTDASGHAKTNVHYCVVDEVTYGTGGRWGQWSDGGGSSLELIDPHSDNRLPSNWADSDDTAKCVWTTLSVTGALDNAGAASTYWNALQVYLLEAGECLVDEVYVSIDGSANLVVNPGFESGLNNWLCQGDHVYSHIENAGWNSPQSLHVVASSRGDTGANRIHSILNSTYGGTGGGTISAKVKWLHGWPEILFRLRGNQLELPGRMTVPANLGTPGARNSRYITNAGPAITEVVHNPILPAAQQAVVVTARVHDPDGLSSVQLVYRLDPGGLPVTVPMVDDGTGGDAVAGDGVYSATVPGQTNNALLAFYIMASDGFATPATTRFPNNAPVRECLVRFGETEPITSFGTYRFWMTRTNLLKWLAHERLSNEPNEGTFIYGNYRAIYNGGSRYAGSPFHAQGFTSPTNSNCDYQIYLPADDPLLNASEMRLQIPGNGGGDATCQNEKIAYWMADQLGLSYLYRRSITLYVNGVRRGTVYEDPQIPSSDYNAEWFSASGECATYKIMFWFEFYDEPVSLFTPPLAGPRNWPAIARLLPSAPCRIRPAITPIFSTWWMR